MPSLKRTISTGIWENCSFFRKLPYIQKYIYLYLLTCRFSSETSVFPFPLSLQHGPLGLEKKEFLDAFNALIEKGLILFDAIEEEVLVVHYFVNHAPNGGLTYEMFANDLAEIVSEELIDRLVEISKSYKISKAFYAALADRRPELESLEKMAEYKITGDKDKTLENVRGFAKKGRENR